MTMTRHVLTALPRHSILPILAAAILPCATVHGASDPSTWISATEAVEIALQAVPATTAFKVELDVFANGQVYEAKTFKNSTVYEIRINPNTGQVVDIDDSDGGGAQDKIAEAQFVISQSMFTLIQAINHIGNQFPDYYMVEIEMENRDGVAIFDMDLVRGEYRLEIRMRASDGVIIKQQLKLLADTSNYCDLYIPPSAPDWNVSNLKTPEQMINIVQQALGGKVFAIELKEQFTNVYRYQVRLLKNNQVIKAKYNARWGTFISSEVITDAQYVNTVKAAASQATLTLKQAIAQARTAAPDVFAIEAKLRTQENGTRYEVEFLTSGGFLEVKVNSATGGIVQVQFED
jgi:uncharacterized membrane protein YkoI